MTAPKLFISYSWSNPEHEQWVLGLATELCESGVDVILDKWNLREGQDSIAFMEKMVTDADIKKVALILDKAYVAKADGRAGGVGTETQIISKDIYDQQDQGKFVAIVSEKDENGKPFLPAYYRSKIYIDLSEADRYSGNFEQLLRWIFDKPLYIKPELGRKPSFLDDGEHVSLGTTATFKRCMEALKNNKPNATGAYDEYCNIFVQNLERFRISQPQSEFDEAVIRNIEEFIPFRNEMIQLFTTIAHYSPTPVLIQRTHRLFENLIPYLHCPENIKSWCEGDFDNFRFLIHELYLYALAIFIKSECFDQARYLMEQKYYYPDRYKSRTNVMLGYTLFREYIKSLDLRNERLKLNRMSLRADLLSDRCKGIGIDFRYLMQADFIAFMRSEIEEEKEHGRWYPDTLLYLDRSHQPFEIFARSASKKYFDTIKCLLSINSVEDLEPLFQKYKNGSRKLPQRDFQSLNLVSLMGIEQLATQA
jgi:TIR domain